MPILSPIARCASKCLRQVLAVDEEAHRASARPTCEAAAAVAHCIEKIAPWVVPLASEYAQNYDASRERLEVPIVVRAECLTFDNETIALCRHADGRIEISTSSSPSARGSRSLCPSTPVLYAAAQDPVACTPRQETDGLDLISLMIGPVQHFPRYRGLLEDMQRSARPPARAAACCRTESARGCAFGTHGRR